MKYIKFEVKNNRRDKIAELRANLISVHNKYCCEKIDQDPKFSLSLKNFIRYYGCTKTCGCGTFYSNYDVIFKGKFFFFLSIYMHEIYHLHFC